MPAAVLPPSPPTIHLIANAHLDPVWLWDWREGFDEGITTCRTVLDLMDEFPELTFNRGESSVYEHIERFDPATFERIRGMIAAGRWDVIGGSYVQPDTNLTSEAVMRKQFTRGLAYFQDRLGVRPTVAWAADSFGHSAGLPSIFAAAGMRGFAFTRPFPQDFALPNPVFWWEGPDGARVLAYRPEVGVYLTERDELPRRLDGCLAAAREHGRPVGCFWGLGNHGGGPTRRQLRDLAGWREAHPEARVVHSGLHRLFEAFHEHAAANGGDGAFPTFRGELNYCLRGCYSSAARVKFAYRRAEAAILRAEMVAEHVVPAVNAAHAPDLRGAWDAVLFNAFHDILPGSSIERALDEQLDQLGGALHRCRETEHAALRALAARVDTTVPPVDGDGPTAVPFLLFNPHPEPFRGWVELECNLDYRPLFQYHNKAEIPPVEVRGPDHALRHFQTVRTESDPFRNLPWRRRVVTPVELPARGWQVWTLGFVEDAEVVALPANTAPAAAPEPGVLDNGIYRVEARPGTGGVKIFHRGPALLDGDGLAAFTVEDPWGSWGGMAEEPASFHLNDVRHVWTVQRVETTEIGPLRSQLWVRLTGGNSWLELTFSLFAGREAVDVSARLLWNERAARLKLNLGQAPAGAEFAVPGGTVRRAPGGGELPGGRWVRMLRGPDDPAPDGFASDALYNFDLSGGLLRATVVRATRFAAGDPMPADVEPFLPATDQGELRFRFLLAPGDAALPRLALELEQPPLVAIATPTPGEWPRAGALTSASAATASRSGKAKRATRRC